MNYRGYLMQMAQRGKVIKTGGTLRIMNKQPYIKKSHSGSTGVYSGGTVRKLILDRLDNGIEPLTTSVSTLSIGKKYRKKASKKASKKVTFCTFYIFLCLSLSEQILSPVSRDILK